jgi:hypothetical protein
MEIRKKKRKKDGKRTMEEENNKLLVLVTYTIKLVVLSLLFFPFSWKKDSPAAFLFFFCFHVCTHTKKVRFPTAVPIPQRRRADNILASALICPF